MHSHIQKEIKTLIKAKFPILYICTWEENRALSDISAIANKLDRSNYVWSLTKGITPDIQANHISKSNIDPQLKILLEVQNAKQPSVFTLLDFHHYIEDHRVVRMLRDIAHDFRTKNQTLIIVAPKTILPSDLEKDITLIDYPLPNENEINEQINLIQKATQKDPQLKTNITKTQREQVIKSAQGLTLEEIVSSFARSLVETKRLDQNTILQEKKQIIKKTGLLEYYSAEESLKDVGGHNALKQWLETRKKSFTKKAQQFGLPIPKGILLLGVQGCGKSLVAKSVASNWNLPILKMDVGKIFGSLVGQSEQNIRGAISIAESIAPCILWVDEFEKGFGSSQNGVSDSGTSARVLATLLTWMQEKTAPVFLIATANDITNLPPELLRKGRFDEIFFADLPQEEERKEIFKIHLEKRKRNTTPFDLDQLAKLSEGFSGSEIEHSVVDALHIAFEHNEVLSQEHLKDVISQIVPLSIMMQKEIDDLRKWAEKRTRKSTA